jgi:hypothetical protein
MSRRLLAVAGGLALPSVALAEEPDGERIFRFMGGFGSGLAPAVAPYADGLSAGGHAGGRALLQMGRFAGDFGVREGLYSGDLRSVGALFFGARYTPDSPWSARVGFAHNHEVADDVLLAEPVAAVAGFADGIRHRSGAEVGVGHHWDVDRIWEPGRLGVQLETSAEWMAGEKGPNLYGFVDLYFTLDVGPRLAR